MYFIKAQIPQNICGIDDEFKAINHGKDTVCIWVFQSRDDRNNFMDATGIHIIRNILEEVAQGLEGKMFSRAPDTKAKQTIISQDLKPVRKEHLREFLTYRRDFRFDLVSIQWHETFKYLSQGDIGEFLGEAEFARFDEKRQMFVGKRRRGEFSSKGGPETFEQISTKRTEHLLVWMIELERSGQVSLTPEDEIRNYEIRKENSKIYKVG